MGYIEEPRPCLVDGAQALFHGFYDVEKPYIENGRVVGTYKNTRALIEFRNGSVEPVNVKSVRFLDGAEKFSQYDWGEANA